MQENVKCSMVIKYNISLFTNDDFVNTIMIHLGIVLSLYVMKVNT